MKTSSKRYKNRRKSSENGCWSVKICQSLNKPRRNEKKLIRSWANLRRRRLRSQLS